MSILIINVPIPHTYNSSTKHRLLFHSGVDLSLHKYAYLSCRIGSSFYVLFVWSSIDELGDEFTLIRSLGCYGLCLSEWENLSPSLCLGVITNETKQSSKNSQSGLSTAELEPACLLSGDSRSTISTAGPWNTFKIIKDGILGRTTFRRLSTIKQLCFVLILHILMSLFSCLGAFWIRRSMHGYHSRIAKHVPAWRVGWNNTGVLAKVVKTKAQVLDCYTAWLWYYSL